mmetsp:Transcript_16045/g.36693  ORF Transcript_16045/g.36693 Transcript_16045/m.36693 type:complete len:222 (+) Transcript_16045:301-966(+)
MQALFRGQWCRRGTHALAAVRCGLWPMRRSDCCGFVDAARCRQAAAAGGTRGPACGRRHPSRVCSARHDWSVARVLCGAVRVGALLGRVLCFVRGDSGRHGPRGCGQQPDGGHGRRRDRRRHDAAARLRKNAVAGRADKGKRRADAGGPRHLRARRFASAYARHARPCTVACAWMWYHHHSVRQRGGLVTNCELILQCRLRRQLENLSSKGMLGSLEAKQG